MKIIENNRGKDIKEVIDNKKTHPAQETPDIETSSEDYATRFSGSIGEWFLQVQERGTLKMLSDLPNAMLLDVGGGHGKLTGSLVRNGYKVTIVGSAIECQNRIQEHLIRNECEFKIGDLLDLPFNNYSFDLVISFRLLPHIKNWYKLVSELTRVARKAVIIDYPSLRSINYFTPWFFNLKKQVEGNTRYYRSFYERELLQAFKEFGFVKSKRYAEFFLPMVLHRALRFPFFSIAVESLFRSVGLTALFGSPVILRFDSSGGII